MKDENRPPRPAAGGGCESDGERPTARIGDDACDRVLAAVGAADNSGMALTLWDLPKATGLPLHESFAAARTLEFGRLLKIDDSPSDPFGAKLSVEKAAAARLRKLHAE